VTNSVLPIQVQTGVGEPSLEIRVNRYIIEKGMDRQLVLYWYQSHGRVIASEYAAKFFLVRDAMQLNRTDAALVRVIAPFNSANGEAAAESLTTSFVKALFPRLGQYIPS
jgi:EpsI family protein